MSFHRSGSLSSGFNMNISVKNEPDDRFDYVNFDTDNLKYQRTFHDHQLENDDPTFEILLLPEITRSSTFSCSSTSKYSPTNQTSQHQIIQNHYSSPGNQLNNNKNMNMNMNESVVELIQQSSVDDNNQVGVSSTRTALSNIQDFVETTIVLRKDKKNQLGISIVGGNDTYLVSKQQLINPEFHSIFNLKFQNLISFPNSIPSPIRNSISSSLKSFLIGEIK